MTEYIVPAVVAVLAPSVGWLVTKVIETDKKQAVHEASDVATFLAIDQHLTELKDEQRNQTNKLDQLITGMLVDARNHRS